MQELQRDSKGVLDGGSQVAWTGNKGHLKIKAFDKTSGGSYLPPLNLDMNIAQYAEIRNRKESQDTKSNILLSFEN